MAQQDFEVHSNQPLEAAKSGNPPSHDPGAPDGKGDSPPRNDQNQTLAGQAKQTTSQVVDKVQEHANTRLEEQKKTAVEGLTNVADAVRQAGQSLKQQPQVGITQYAAEYGQKAAQQIERVTRYLQERDVNQLVDDVEDFARRQPAYFLGAAFVTGFVAARFLKSSRPAPTSVPGSVNRQLPAAAPRQQPSIVTY